MFSSLIQISPKGYSTVFCVEAVEKGGPTRELKELH
jgi:hypothetical protein